MRAFQSAGLLAFRRVAQSAVQPGPGSAAMQDWAVDPVARAWRSDLGVIKLVCSDRSTASRHDGALCGRRHVDAETRRRRSRIEPGSARAHRRALQLLDNAAARSTAELRSGAFQPLPLHNQHHRPYTIRRGEQLYRAYA